MTKFNEDLDKLRKLTTENVILHIRNEMNTKEREGFIISREIVEEILNGYKLP
jgi:hypothetical protein